MNAVEYIVEHPEFKHGEIKVGFTPDEEIGRGVVKFDEEIRRRLCLHDGWRRCWRTGIENFNAASATVHIQGRNVHPGYAKAR
jgi:tripeptide aminopeptidase